jgi:predicted unusual protein kinase regulating ubiquinone biosynthesis (AarF/ABC1/UbiB family)
MILSPRYLPRLTAMFGLFTRYGLAHIVTGQGLDDISHLNEPTGDGSSPASVDQATAFRERLVELGPAYVKLGQVLSTRPDLLPEPYVAALEKLQDDVGDIPLAVIEQTIETELGGRISKLFDTFDEAPLGSASLGQVHAATLRDGRPVVVKVQRPNIREQLADDVEFFRELARFLTEHTAAGTRVDLLGVVQQLERSLADELDYRIEARNAAGFRRTLAEFPRIIVPRVIEAYCTERVLTVERVRGVKINEVSPLVRLEHDFGAVVNELTRAYLKQIAIDGHFHADPHPGNVFVVLSSQDNPPTPTEIRENDRRALERPGATPLARLENLAEREAAASPADLDVRLALIDFGMTARLSTTLRRQIVQLLLDVADNRGDAAAQVLIEIGSELPDFDRNTYVREVAALLARNYDLPVGEVLTGTLLFELINISFQRGVRPPPELALLAKALVNLDSVTRAIDPTFSPLPAIREFAGHMAAERVKRELNPRRLYEVALDANELLSALPHRLDLITRKMASDDFALNIEIPQLALMMEASQKVANRVFSGLVLAGLLAASGMVMPYQRSLGVAGFLLAGVIGVWMVLSILWADREKKRRS